MIIGYRKTRSRVRITLASTAIVVIAFGSLASHLSSKSRAKGDQDGPVEVKYGNIFQAGELKIEPFNLADLPPLPAGYTALNNKAYRITTSAVVSGLHTIRFAVPSVTDQDAFRKLRVFQVDTDPFDPDGLVWVDVTLLNSAKYVPSFSSKTIYGESEGLGVFVIAKLVREVPPSTTTADLVVTTNGAADRLTAPSLISYTIKVFNKGPDDATDVGVWDSVSGPVKLVSFKASQGKCKPTFGQIVCKAGSLKAGESMTVAVELKPYEGRGSFPQEGKEIIHEAGAKAGEKDPAQENNEVSDTVLVFPDPNQLPTVTLDSPEDRAVFIGPTDITLKATAQDSDGSIAKVEFFDNDKPLGLGTSVDGKRFVFTARGLSYGNHGFVAVATDNDGRTDWSIVKEVFINGLAVVSIKAPPLDSLLEPGPDFTLAAVASHPSGVINKVEFFANGRLLGEGSLSGENTYTFNWKSPHRGKYSIAAIAIDGSGIRTFSAALELRIGKRSEVVITSPGDSARFSAPTNLNITAKARQPDGFISRVDFYADDRLIGSVLSPAETFIFIWRNVPEGQHTLKAVAVNDVGVTESSKAITVKIGKLIKSD